MLLLFAALPTQGQEASRTLTYDCAMNPVSGALARPSCARQIESPAWKDEYRKRLQDYDGVISIYNNFNNESLGECLHPSVMFCRILRFHRFSGVVAAINATRDRMKEHLLASAHEAMHRCPDHPTAVTRYANVFARMMNASGHVRAFDPVASYNNRGWAIPGVLLSASIILFAAVVLITALIARTIRLYPVFVIIAGLILVQSMFRFSWLSMHLVSSTNYLVLQLLSRTAAILFTIVLAVFCYAWGSAVAKALSKDGSVVRWKRYLAVGLLIYVIAVATVYAMVMAIVTAVLPYPVFDAAPILLPCVQLFVAASLALFVVLARRKILADSTSEMRNSRLSHKSRKSQGRARVGASAQVKAVNSQLMVVLIVLLCISLSVVFSFIAEFTTWLPFAAEMTLRSTISETITSVVFLVCLFIVLRPQKNPNANGYVLMEDDPNSIPEQYEA